MPEYCNYSFIMLRYGHLSQQSANIWQHINCRGMICKYYHV